MPSDPAQGYGFAEVEQLYGLETIRNAADQLKRLYGGKGKTRLKLFISIKGIKLFECSTMVSGVQLTSYRKKLQHIFMIIRTLATSLSG